MRVLHTSFERAPILNQTFGPLFAYPGNAGDVVDAVTHERQDVDHLPRWYAEPFLDAIRAFDRAGKPIAAICVGALPLAKSGVLAGRRATTYKLLGGKRRQQLAEMGAEVVDAALVRDGNVITSAGPSTAVGVALPLVETLTSPENAAQIRELMGFKQ